MRCANASKKTSLLMYPAEIWSESSFTSVLYVCKQQRPWQVWAYVQTCLRLAAQWVKVPNSCVLANMSHVITILIAKAQPLKNGKCSYPAISLDIKFFLSMGARIAQSVAC